jgi:hypothetical protein
VRAGHSPISRDQQVHQLLAEVLGSGLHAKRITSLADAKLAVVLTASLASAPLAMALGDRSWPECPTRGQAG